ncbi:MAG: tripartite tricarboxylate transporter substrate binding protein [Cytophagaceae bacterium]|nr:MAG: tripartite tricarboxylate transporter substrate binding protein [Cytophagaceae bacterium]
MLISAWHSINHHRSLVSRKSLQHNPLIPIKGIQAPSLIKGSRHGALAHSKTIPHRIPRDRIINGPSKRTRRVKLYPRHLCTLATRPIGPHRRRINSIQQLIADSKNNKAGVFYGISALYSVNQALMTQLASITGAQWTAVPFKGDAESINALLGGQVQAISATNGILPFVTSGKVRVLATAGARRTKDFQDVPTLLEAGYQISVSSPLGIAGPAGMPPEAVAAIDKAVRTAVQDPTFQATMDRYGISLDYQDSSTYTEYARKTAVAEKDIVKLMKSEKQ